MSHLQGHSLAAAAAAAPGYCFVPHHVPANTTQVINKENLTPAWVAREGLQVPTRILKTSSDDPSVSALTPALTLDNLTAVGGLLHLLDREAQTLDVSRQTTGPRWNLRWEVGPRPPLPPPVLTYGTLLTGTSGSGPSTGRTANHLPE